jgi:hypothetical protein
MICILKSKGLGMVVRAYNSSYLGSRDQDDYSWRSAQAKVSKTTSQPVSQACKTCLCSQLQGELYSEASPGQKHKILSEKQNKTNIKVLRL